MTTATFSPTGSVQTWVCPAGVTTVTIEGWGGTDGGGTFIVYIANDGDDGLDADGNFIV